ncbi:MAG TPA: protein kinase [Gemmatimonadaceae bacterium]
MEDSLGRLDAALTGRYRIERELGVGGMATVFIAADLKHHRKVAVKVVRPELAASLGAERFLREIDIAAKLQHPHILPLYDSGGAGELLFYVMPLVEGQSLRDRLAKGGALPIDEAVRIIREVADALAYSHKHGVVHRDIKPENILLSSGHALVTDFGVAKAVSESASTADLTGTGVSLGTPAYMAPEQVTADPGLDHRVDIYALGVMAYELLAGRAPFLGNPQQIIAGHLTRPPDSLAVHRHTVPPALANIVMRCLEKNPADRPQSADEVLRALEAMTTTGQVTAATAPALPPAAARAGRRWSPVIAGAVAVALLAVAGVAWFARVGRAGTLIGDDVLAENDLVLVSEFQNHTADSSLAATVTDAIRVELQQSRAVRVMSQAAMWAGLARMGLDHGTLLPEPKVQELAEREGVKAYVVGEISPLGNGYQITARVAATAGVSDALTARSTATDETQLIGAVEKVGRELRRGIGESLRSVMTAPALAKVTTASLPALRAYTAAQRAHNEGLFPRAVALAREAIALDSTFAGAWSAMYAAYSNMNAVGNAAEAARHAYELKDRLPELERLRIEARYHAIRGDATAEEAAWARLAELGREEANYANMLLGMRRLPEAEAMSRRAVASDPKSSIAYWNLAEAQVGQHRFAAADSTLALLTANLPDNRYRYFIRVSNLWGRRDYDALQSYLHSPDAAQYPTHEGHQCVLDLQRGRIRAWQGCQARDVFVVQNPQLFMAEFRMTGDTARARLGYASFLANPPGKRNPDRYAGTIALLADMGRAREARNLFDEWRARFGPTDPGYRADSAQAVGAILAAEGHWERAVSAFLAWNTSPAASAMHLYNRGLPEAAAILARRGQPDSAIVLFERALSTSSAFGGFTYETGWYAQGLLILGELYEARGDRAKAAEYYERYVKVFKDPDPPIAAQLAAVREKLARVTGEPGGPNKR